MRVIGLSKIKDRKNNLIVNIFSKYTIIAVIVFLLLFIFIGLSYAVWNYNFLGEINTIDTKGISIEFLESDSNIINIENSLPMSDKEGMLQEESFDFMVRTNSDKKMDFVYSLVIEKIDVDPGYTSLADSDIKIYLSDYNEIGLISPVLISDLGSNYVFYTDINKHNNFINMHKDMFKLRSWINFDTDVSDWTDETNLQYKFKIGLVSSDDSSNLYLPISSHINSLYNSSEKSTVINNGVTYNYVPDYSLLNDRFGGTSSTLDNGNIRYYGEDPDNYVYFNCTDYDNPDSSNCERWRIIGLFNDVQDDGTKRSRVKLIRSDSLGNYSFDTSPSSVNGGNGVHAFEKADLMHLFNPSYSDLSVNNSLYWERSSGKCYTGKNDVSTNCNFSATGLTADTRDMISTSVYHLGTFTKDDYNQMMNADYDGFMEKFYANLMYSYERSNNVYDCSVDDGACPRATTWSGKVALMYPSDYIYATDFTECSYNGIGFGWSDWNHTNLVTDACYTNDWLSFDSGQEWVITPHYEPRYRSFTIMNGKYVFGAYNYRNYRVRPVLYLNENVLLTGGDGSFELPYTLSSS